MNCSRCSAEVGEFDKYCPSCGLPQKPTGARSSPRKPVEKQYEEDVDVEDVGCRIVANVAVGGPRKPVEKQYEEDEEDHATRRAAPGDIGRYMSEGRAETKTRLNVTSSSLILDTKQDIAISTPNSQTVNPATAPVGASPGSYRRSNPATRDPSTPASKETKASNYYKESSTFYEYMPSLRDEPRTIAGQIRSVRRHQEPLVKNQLNFQAPTYHLVQARSHSQFPEWVVPLALVILTVAAFVAAGFRMGVELWTSLRWIMTGLSTVVWLFLAILNSFEVRPEVPGLGGIAGGLALLACPVPDTAVWAWVPAALDRGSLPWLARWAYHAVQKAEVASIPSEVAPTGMVDLVGDFDARPNGPFASKSMPVQQAKPVTFQDLGRSQELVRDFVARTQKEEGIQLKELAFLLELTPTAGSIAVMRLKLGEFLTIGRQPGNVGAILQLNDELVSAKHCRIQRNKDGYYLADLSTNGTFVNGEKLRGVFLLKSGDQILIPKSSEASSGSIDAYTLVFICELKAVKQTLVDLKELRRELREIIPDIGRIKILLEDAEINTSDIAMTSANEAWASILSALKNKRNGKGLIRLLKVIEEEGYDSEVIYRARMRLEGVTSGDTLAGTSDGGREDV